MTRTLALAAVAAALLAAPTLAAAQQTTTTASQPVPNPPPQTTRSGPGTVDPGYSGALKGPAFLDVDARIASHEGKGGARHASMLRSIKAEARMRRAKNGGELRDWDRELLNKKLDALESMH